MPSLVQDLGILEAAAGDVASFAAGGTVSTSIDGYEVSAKLLTGGPVAPYQTFSGSFLQILGLAFADYESFALGAPISIAEKFGNSWYGISLSKPAVAATASVKAEPVA